jgi:hypothetical protein
LCICEGQQEKLYLEHLAGLIKDFPKKAVKFNIYIDQSQRLDKTYENFDSAALFDYDFDEYVLHNIDEARFQSNIRYCDLKNKKLKPTSRKEGRYIYHAYSNVNFDLWLILHKEACCKHVTKNDAYIEDIKRIYGLGSIDNIKSEPSVRKILKQIELEDVKTAIFRADEIRNNKLEDDAVELCSTKIYQNPDFSINNFVRIVLQDCGDLPAS